MEQQTTPIYAEKGPITEELLSRMDAWFRAANYLSAGQLYLLENPLLLDAASFTQSESWRSFLLSVILFSVVICRR